ncbi:hypothetical protein TorRG33x02_227360 [Trema orientale]|uniref:Uncharacterized protein n=1 Tax=Trema orientale TaxID=63057 RepID=A0A2P5E7D4_TREOI|nr:hypothetical protein TorRG33x02_227360 [Trema orientale]
MAQMVPELFSCINLVLKVSIVTIKLINFLIYIFVCEIQSQWNRFWNDLIWLLRLEEERLDG